MKRPVHPAVPIALAVVLATAALPAVAIDWGATLDTRSTLTVAASDPPPLILLQENRLALWLEADFGAAGSLFAQGSWSLDRGRDWTYTASPFGSWFPRGSDTVTASRDWLVDLDALRYEARLFSMLNLSVGRFGMADFSRYILADTLDGLEITLNQPWSILSAYVGTSALRFIPNTTILMSGNDASDASDPDKLLAPPRLVVGLQALSPEIFLRQDLTVSLLFQQDLRSQVIQEGEELQFPGGLVDGPLHTQYFGLGLSGPIVPGLYYSLYGYLGTGSALEYLADADSGTGFSYQRQALLGGFGALELAYYLPQAARSRIALSVLYSQALVPISQPTFTVLYSPRFGDIMTADLSYSVKPFSGSPRLWLRELQGELTVATYLRTDVLEYAGTEIDAAVNYRPFSDLGLALILGTYLPEGAAAQFAGRFELSLSF